MTDLASRRRAASAQSRAGDDRDRDTRGRARLRYPLVLKPARVQARRYVRGGQRAELEDALARMHHVGRGQPRRVHRRGRRIHVRHVCIGGKPAFEMSSKYLPKPLIARRPKDQSGVIVTVRDNRKAGARTEEFQLGEQRLERSHGAMGCSRTMEWSGFANRRPSRVGEIRMQHGRRSPRRSDGNYTVRNRSVLEWGAPCAGKTRSTRRRTAKYKAAIILSARKGHGRSRRAPSAGKQIDGRTCRSSDRRGSELPPGQGGTPISPNRNTTSPLGCETTTLSETIRQCDEREQLFAELEPPYRRRARLCGGRATSDPNGRLPSVERAMSGVGRYCAKFAKAGCRHYTKGVVREFVTSMNMRGWPRRRDAYGTARLRAVSAAHSVRIGACCTEMGLATSG